MKVRYRRRFLKELKGVANRYRIRVGEYRVGIAVDNQNVELM